MSAITNPLHLDPASTGTDDPLLNTAGAAERLGCDEHGVLFLYREGKLAAEPEAHGRRVFLRFRQSAVDAVRPYYRRLRDFQEQGYHDHPERGCEYTLKGLTKARGLAMNLLRQATERYQQGKSRPGEPADPLALPFEELDPPPTGAKPWKIVRLADALNFEERIKERRRRASKVNGDRWKRHADIALALGIKDCAGNRELSECARCWEALGEIKTELVLIEMPGKVFSSRRTLQGLRPIDRSRRTKLYDFTKLKTLWEADYIAAGKKVLTELLKEHGRGIPTATAAQALKAVGIVGARRRRVLKKAGLRRTHGRGITSGRQCVYVRKTVKTPKARDIVEQVRGLFPASGELPAGEGMKKALALGLTQAEVYAALRALGVPVQRGRPGWCWRLPEATESSRAASDGSKRPSTPAQPPPQTDRPPNPRHLRWKQWRAAGLTYGQIVQREKEDFGEEITREAVMMALKRLKGKPQGTSPSRKE